MQPDGGCLAEHQSQPEIGVRDYTYIWHDPDTNVLVASGIECRDVLELLEVGRSLFLLSGQPVVKAKFDWSARFKFLPAKTMAQIPSEEVYSWGDNCWADFTGDKPPALGKQGLAELIYFAHMREPFNGPVIPDLGNRFLYFGHDDDWYMALYYKDLDDGRRLVESVTRHHAVNASSSLCQQILAGQHGFWMNRGQVIQLEKTHDIDALLNSTKYPTT
jgi:hypothetical protein